MVCGRRVTHFPCFTSTKVRISRHILPRPGFWGTHRMCSCSNGRRDTQFTCFTRITSSWLLWHTPHLFLLNWQGKPSQSHDPSIGICMHVISGSIRPHTSACVSIRQGKPSQSHDPSIAICMHVISGSIRPHTPAYSGIRQHASTYVRQALPVARSVHRHLYACDKW